VVDLRAHDREDIDLHLAAAVHARGAERRAEELLVLARVGDVAAPLVVADVDPVRADELHAVGGADDLRGEAAGLVVVAAQVAAELAALDVVGEGHLARGRAELEPLERLEGERADRLAVDGVLDLRERHLAGLGEE